MQNTPSLTVIKNTAIHTTMNTTPPSEGTPNNGALIGRIIAMNLRNRLTQEPNKALAGNIG